jgi:NADH-quinone oxidoreductase subunit J
LLFWVFGVVVVAASLLVVGQRNPLYSALYLILSFGALAGLYVLLDAAFVAVIQIIIYAGAIVVLFLFVVMLLNVSKEDAPAGNRSLLMGAGPRRFGVVLSLVLVVELAWALSNLSGTPLQPGMQEITVRDIGVRLFTDYAFAFEATSVLILVAMVGAIVLARKETP